MSPWQVVVPVLAIVGLFVCAYQYQIKIEKEATDKGALPPFESSVYWAVFWGVMWILASFWFAYLCANGTPKVPGGPDANLLFSLFLLSGVIGGTAGWLLGVYFFPVDSSEAQAFNKIATVVGSLVSGYLLKEVTEVLQFVTNTDSGKKMPLLLTHGYRECVGFFLVSLLVSAGVQCAVRTLSAVRISWDGTAPPFDRTKNRYVIEVGKQYQLAGAASGAENIAVRWNLAASNQSALREAEEKQLLTISDDGLLAAKDGPQWSAHSVTVDLDFEIVASAAGRPEVVKALSARVGTLALPPTSQNKPVAALTPAKPEATAGSNEE